MSQNLNQKEYEKIPMIDEVNVIKLIPMDKNQGVDKANLNIFESLLSNGSDLSKHKTSFGFRQKRYDGNRAMSKNGILNYSVENAPGQNVNFFMKDFFSTLMEVKWRYSVLLFFCLNFASWTLFALIWNLIAYLNGDLEHFGEENYAPCVSNVRNFASAFIFSVETQTTIGYGYYEISADCPEAIIVFCFQSMVGVMIEGLLVGIMFVKMIRSKRRSATIVFSQNAVMCHRDGQLYFMFRVADLRSAQHIVEAHVRAQIIRKKVTVEGELIAYSKEEIDVSGDGESNSILLWWPTQIIHKIDEKSPLYSFAKSNFGQELKEKETFEIVVVLEGIVESTGLTMQSRSSYLPNEILLGHRFQPLITSKSKNGERIVADFSTFHQTIPE